MAEISFGAVMGLGIFYHIGQAVTIAAAAKKSSAKTSKKRNFLQYSE